jgi:hypothetical protein
MKYSLQNSPAVHFTEKSARISVTSYSHPAFKRKQASNWSKLLGFQRNVGGNNVFNNKINPLTFSFNRAKRADLY